MSKQPLIKQGNLRTVDIEGEEWLVYLLNPIKKIVLEQDEIPPAVTPEPTPSQELEQKELRDKIIDALCFRQTKDYFARKGEIVPTDSQVDNIEALIQSQVASAVNEAEK